MTSSAHGSRGQPTGNRRRSRLAALAGVLSLAVAAPSEGACPTRPGPDPAEELADYEALLDEIYEMGDQYSADFSIGDQAVYRMRQRSEEGRPDRVLQALEALEPRLEDMQSYFPTPPSRPVLLIESRLDIFEPSLALTDCASPGEERDAAEDDREAELAKHVITRMGGDLRDLPAGLCLVVVFTDRLESERELRFGLAHEWMHTMQNGFYTRWAMDHSWWVEGSAEWFAHKVVDGVTERDHRIEEFFMRQKSCPLTEHSYDAQPFFFWGEQAFNTEWVLSVGLGGDAYLKLPERAAAILPPERWLDWAIAQADQTITMPDGRLLPDQAEVEALELTRECETAIKGPPLSVQLYEISIPEGSAPILAIDAGDAQLAIRGNGDDEWLRVTGLTEIDTPSSPITVAAIAPSGEDLYAKFSIGNSDGGACGCQVGVWLERATPPDEAKDPLAGALEAMESARGMVPPDQMDDFLAAQEKLRAANAKDRFRFRGSIPDVFDELEGDVDTIYVQDGPVLTIRAAGSFLIDDPYTIRAEDTTISYHKYRHYGKWEAEGGVLKFEIEGLISDGFLTGPPDYEPTRISIDSDGFGAQSYVGGGGEWTMACEPAAMTLTSTRVRNPDRSDQAVLVKY
ncbi:hypothetical protein [Hyphococcus sp.]|uniref:hypothetical protein n=1 Tax=Hyphococcus sp. TaxID=2038636 RepID=UPI0035C77D29